MGTANFPIECHSSAPPLCEGSHVRIVMILEIYRFHGVYQVRTLRSHQFTKKVCQSDIRGERLGQNSEKRVFRVQKQIRSRIGLPS